MFADCEDHAKECLYLQNMRRCTAELWTVSPAAERLRRVYVWETGTEPVAGRLKVRPEDPVRPGTMLSCVSADGKILWNVFLSATTKRVAGTSGNSQQTSEGA